MFVTTDGGGFAYLPEGELGAHYNSGNEGRLFGGWWWFVDD